MFFELNGQPRDVNVPDATLESTVVKNLKADASDPTHVASSMPGMVVSVVVEPGEAVKKGQKLLTIEAMKMQTTVNSTRDGKVGKLLVKAGSRVDAGDLLLTIE